MSDEKTISPCVRNQDGETTFTIPDALLNARDWMRMEAYLKRNGDGDILISGFSFDNVVPQKVTPDKAQEQEDE